MYEHFGHPYLGLNVIIVAAAALLPFSNVIAIVWQLRLREFRL